jgi:hypothetical protein
MDKFWICPHQSLDFYDAATAVRQPSWHKNRFETCTHSSCASNITTAMFYQYPDGETHYLLKSSIRLYDTLDLDSNHHNLCGYSNQDRVREALTYLPMPICSHISLSDISVWERFSPRKLWHGHQRRDLDSHILWKSPFLPRQVSRCSHCRKAGATTLYAFTTMARDKHAKVVSSLYLDVYRDLGALKRSTSAGWICHAVDKKQREELRIAWPFWIAAIEDARIRWASTPEPESKMDEKWTSKLSRFAWWTCEKAGKLIE